jgi:hypothetical protein
MNDLEARRLGERLFENIRLDASRGFRSLFALKGCLGIFVIILSLLSLDEMGRETRLAPGNSRPIDELQLGRT